MGMGGVCSASEQGVRRTLERIASRFSATDDVDYGFIFHRFEASAGERNWTAAATASVPWKAAGIGDYQRALDAIRSRIPFVD
jgi:hypothetical protein